MLVARECGLRQKRVGKTVNLCEWKLMREEEIQRGSVINQRCHMSPEFPPFFLSFFVKYRGEQNGARNSIFVFIHD